MAEDKHEGLKQIGRDMTAKAIGVVLYSTYEELAKSSPNYKDNLAMIVTTTPKSINRVPIIQIPIHEAKFHKWKIGITFRVYQEPTEFKCDIVKSCHKDILELYKMIVYSAEGYWNEYRDRNREFVEMLEVDCGIQLQLKRDKDNNFIFDDRVKLRCGVDIIYIDPDNQPYYKKTGEPPVAIDNSIADE